jgi:CheY-like chemotaxis protein
MDGYQLLEKIRHDYPQHITDIRAIALTAFASLGDRVKSREAGFRAHLTKPIEVGELVQAIAAVAGKNEPAD